MKFNLVPLKLAFLCFSFLFANVAVAQQSFERSSKVMDVDFGRTPNWAGKHSFGNVFCLNFPESGKIKWLEYAMYNNNALYHSRATYNYPDTTALYVVTSVVPAGRSVEVEIGNMEAQNQRSVQANPSIFKQQRVNGLLGPSLTLTIRNARDGDGKQTVFPFSRSVVSRPDGLLVSLSVHRLFVVGGNRIEVAGLRYYKSPISAEQEAQAISEFSALVEAAANSLQSCTLELSKKFVFNAVFPGTPSTVKDANEAADRGDFKTALSILVPLADKGDVDALGNLGNAYAFGRGVEKDLTKAYSYWIKAADKHLSTAMFNIAMLYSSGQGGLAQDATQAASWFKRAAEHRHAQAMMNLSTVYATGQGFPIDKKLAIAWASLAQSNTNSPQLKEAASNQIKVLFGELSKGEIDEAQRTIGEIAKVIDINVKLYRDQAQAQASK